MTKEEKQVVSAPESQQSGIKARRVNTKMVPLPSTSIVPERDLGKEPILECRHLGIDFGGLHAVEDFDIAVGRTEIAGLIGPNGAGKTTIFNLLTKVYQPTGYDFVGWSGSQQYECSQGQSVGHCSYFPEHSPLFQPIG